MSARVREQPAADDPGVDELMTVQEVAGRCKVPERTVHDWIYRGIGPASFRVGKYRRFKRSVVERWLDEQASAA